MTLATLKPMRMQFAGPSKVWMIPRAADRNSVRRTYRELRKLGARPIDCRLFIGYLLAAGMNGRDLT